MPAQAVLQPNAGLMQPGAGMSQNQLHQARGKPVTAVSASSSSTHSALLAPTHVVIPGLPLSLPLCDDLSLTYDSRATAPAAAAAAPAATSPGTAVTEPLPECAPVWPEQTDGLPRERRTPPEPVYKSPDGPALPRVCPVERSPYHAATVEPATAGRNTVASTHSGKGCPSVARISRCPSPRQGAHADAVRYQQHSP
jgi:hypothetical protein